MVRLSPCGRNWRWEREQQAPTNRGGANEQCHSVIRFTRHLQPPQSDSHQLSAAVRASPPTCEPTTMCLVVVQSRSNHSRAAWGKRGGGCLSLFREEKRKPTAPYPCHTYVGGGGREKATCASNPPARTLSPVRTWTGNPLNDQAALTADHHSRGLSNGRV